MGKRENIYRMFNLSRYENAFFCERCKKKLEDGSLEEFPLYDDKDITAEPLNVTRYCYECGHVNKYNLIIKTELEPVHNAEHSKWCDHD